MDTGSLVVLSGCMFAGKTKSLIQIIRGLLAQGHEVAVLKPIIDTRYSKTDIVSHDGFRVNAVSVDLDAQPFPQGMQHIAIDEVQFLSEKGIALVLSAVAEGKHVYVSGLDLTSNAEPFGQMPKLLEKANQVIKLQATCAVCGSAQADRTYRLARDVSDVVLVGGAEAYEPRCQACFNGGGHRG